MPPRRGASGRRANAARPGPRTDSPNSWAGLIARTPGKSKSKFREAGLLTPERPSRLFHAKPVWYKPPPRNAVPGIEEADMDQPPPDATTGLAPQERPPLPEAGDDFTPLRLVLQPTGAVIDIHQPNVVVGRHSAADVRLSLPDVEPAALPVVPRRRAMASGGPRQPQRRLGQPGGRRSGGAAARGHAAAGRLHLHDRSFKADPGDRRRRQRRPASVFCAFPPPDEEGRRAS